MNSLSNLNDASIWDFIETGGFNDPEFDKLMTQDLQKRRKVNETAIPVINDQDTASSKAELQTKSYTLIKIINETNRYPEKLKIMLEITKRIENVREENIKKSILVRNWVEIFQASFDFNQEGICSLKPAYVAPENRHYFYFFPAHYRAPEFAETGQNQKKSMHVYTFGALIKDLFKNEMRTDDLDKFISKLIVKEEKKRPKLEFVFRRVQEIYNQEINQKL